MFNFLLMDSYDNRKVDRFEAAWGFVSTCGVNDSEQPYETAVQHTNYNNGKMVIVEMYDTKQQAQEGHNKWVAAMTAQELPEKLVDRSTSGVATMVDVFSNDTWREHPRS